MRYWYKIQHLLIRDARPRGDWIRRPLETVEWIADKKDGRTMKGTKVRIATTQIHAKTSLRPEAQYDAATVRGATE